MATRDGGPFIDVLTNDLTPIPGLKSDFSGALSVHARSNTPACSRAYQEARRTPNLVNFICAQDPKGAVWSVVITLVETPVQSRPEMTDGFGEWQLTVTDRTHVTSGRVYKNLYENAVDCTGRWLDSPWKHESCYGLAWVAPMPPPGAFWFYEPVGKREMQAFAFSGEAVNTGYGEQSVLWWIYRDKKLMLHPANDRIAIVFLRECEKRLTVLASPYRRAGDDFYLWFGNYGRKTAPEWAVLGVVHDGEVRFDSELSKQFAAKQCDDVPEDPFAADPYWWPHTLHCQKIFGATAQKLSSRLNQACREPSEPKTADFCKRNRAMLERIIAAELPLNLTPQERKNSEIPACLQDLLTSSD